MEKRKYENYDKYVKHQSEKTQNMSDRHILSPNFEKKVNLFKKRFSLIKDYNLGKVLCLGARFGEEVVAFNSLGFEAFGIDLVPKASNILKGDFNNLPFKSELFNVVYTNSLDHAYDMDLIFENVYRVLKNGGYFFLDVQFHNHLGPYESYFISKNDVEALIKKLSNYFKFVKKVKVLPQLYKAHKDVQLIFKKLEE